MADRTVNININYKINTDDLNKAAGLSQKAQAATDALRGSAQKASSAITQEFQKSNRTILDMQNALTRLKSIIEVTSNPAKLKQLSMEYKTLKAQLDAATKSAFGLDNALKKKGSTVTTLSSQFGKLYSAVQTVLGAAVIRQVVSMTLEMAKLAGNAEGIQRAFERAFPNSVKVMNDLRAATKNTVSDVELMQRTLQATNLGVSVEQLPVLFEFAAARAQQTGESVDYLVDSIVRGIGRKSPLILDNLGLSATRLKEKFDGAALASQSVADVTRGVAEIAREELEKMGGYVETGATKVAQLEATWEEFRVTLSKRIDSSGIVNFFNEAVSGANNLLKTQKEIDIETVKQRAATELASLQENQLAKEREINGRNVVITQQELINRIQDEIRQRMTLIEHGRVEFAILQDKFKQASETRNGTVAEINANIEIRKQIVEQSKGIRANVDFYKETIRLLKAYQAELTKVTDVEKQNGIIERKKEEIKLIQEQIEKTNDLADLGVGGRLTSRLEIAQAELGDLLRAFSEFKIPEFKLEVKDATKTLTDMTGVIARIEGQINELKNFKWPPLPNPYTPTFWDKLGDEVEERWRDIASIGVDINADQLKSILDSEVDNMKARLSALRDFYDNQQALAGNNERAKAELRIKEERETAILQRKIFDKEKQVRKSQALIDGAAGIVKAFATYPYPAAIVISALIAAQTASQIAIINRQQPRFAKGVIDLKGPGTATSDSIPAHLSRGESVMTAQETKESMGILKAIRNKELNDEILNKLHVTNEGVKYVGMDDTRIVNELRKQRAPDYMAHANLLWEVRKSSDGLHTKIRRKSMG